MSFSLRTVSEFYTILAKCGLTYLPLYLQMLFACIRYRYCCAYDGETRRDGDFICRTLVI